MDEFDGRAHRTARPDARSKWLRPRARVLPMPRPEPQPALPQLWWARDPVSGDPTPERHRFGWPRATRLWWARLGELPEARRFSGVEWGFLLDTALEHRAMVVASDGRQRAEAAREVRARLERMGLGGPESRQRLRALEAQARVAAHLR